MSLTVLSLSSGGKLTSSGGFWEVEEPKLPKLPKPKPVFFPKAELVDDDDEDPDVPVLFVEVLEKLNPVLPELPRPAKRLVPVPDILWS